MAQFVYGADFAVTAVARAFFNTAPSNALFLSLKEFAGTTAESQFSFATAIGAQFDSLTDAALAELVLTNMGILPSTAEEDTDLQMALTDYFGQVGMANRGIVVLQLSSILAGLENETGELSVYADSAAKWNNEINNSFQYSANAANTTNYVGDFPVIPDNQGQTFTLTTGVDAIVGTGGNDTIVGIAQGGANNTFGGLDKIDGGAGNDTLELTNSGGTMNLATSVKVSNVENLVLRSAQNAITADVQSWTGLENVSIEQLGAAANIAVTTKANATSANIIAGTSGAGTVTVNDAGTTATKADTLASVSVAGALGAITVGSDALANLTLVDSAVVATVNNATVGHTLNVTVNNQSGGAGVQDSVATTVNVTATGADSDAFDVDAASATAINFAGDKDLEVTLGATQAANLKITSAVEGALAIDTVLDNDVTFTGGAGQEMVTVGATTKTIDMGAGDDVVEVTAALGAGGKLIGGEGSDTLLMASSLAASLSGSTAFSKQIEGFEVLALDEVAEGDTDTINMSNMKDISTVVSNGTETGNGSAEVVTITFSALLSGQQLSIGDGTNSQTLTAPAGNLTANQAASAFAADFTANPLAADYDIAFTPGSNVATLTAKTLGTQPDLSATVTNSPVNDLGNAATTTQGQDAVTAVAQKVEVSVSGLIAGESVTVTGENGARTVTATAINEQAVVTFADVNVPGTGGNKTIEINGLILTLEDDGAGVTYAAADIASAVAGNPVSGITSTGALVNYTASANGAEVTFDATVLGTNLADITVSGSGAGGVQVNSITQGNNGNLTAAQVATALASGTTAGAAVVSGTGFDYTGTASGSTVTFVADTAEARDDVTASSTSGTQPVVDQTVEGVDAVTGATEVAEVTFTALTSGQSVEVAGRTVTALDGDLNAAEVANAFQGGVNAGNAVVGGTLTGWTAAAPAGATVTFTSTTAGAVDDIDTVAYGVTAAPVPATPGVAIVDGANTGGGGQLNLTNFADNGTLELTDAINGASSVVLKNNTANDTFNLVLNGWGAIQNSDTLTVANVENINITTGDDNALFDTMTGASEVMLNAADAKKVVIAGNHGVDLTSSAFGANLVEVDASGVQATGLTGANLSAAQIATNKGMAGAVSFTAAQTNKDFTIMTGNGNDMVKLGALLDATAAATKGATVSTGEGNDQVWGSAGKDMIDLGAGNDTVYSSAGTDTITLGAGNDTYQLQAVTNSTINARDVITDFQANTVGQGTGGAVNGSGAAASMTARTGDVIDLKAVAGNLNTVNVAVFGNAANATTFLANSAGAGQAGAAVNIALDSSTGYLYIDANDNGIADSVIELTGVTSIDAAAFVIV